MIGLKRVHVVSQRTSDFIPFSGPTDYNPFKTSIPDLVSGGYLVQVQFFSNFNCNISNDNINVIRENIIISLHPEASMLHDVERKHNAMP
jgi:hypothetical protein